MHVQHEQRTFQIYSKLASPLFRSCRVCIWLSNSLSIGFLDEIPYKRTDLSLFFFFFFFTQTFLPFLLTHSHLIPNSR